MCIPPNNEEQLHTLDTTLENLKNETIVLFGDFNARNTIWDKNCAKNSKLREILEDIIHRHNLYITTDVDHTYYHSPTCEHSGKNTVDLTLIRGIK